MAGRGTDRLYCYKLLNCKNYIQNMILRLKKKLLSVALIVYTRACKHAMYSIKSCQGIEGLLRSTQSYIQHVSCIHGDIFNVIHQCSSTSSPIHTHILAFFLQSSEPSPSNQVYFSAERGRRLDSFQGFQNSMPDTALNNPQSSLPYRRRFLYHFQTSLLRQIRLYCF